MLKPDTTLTESQMLLKTLLELRHEVYEEGQATFNNWRSYIQRRDFLISALNLAYYLALRRRDLRQLQAALVPWGLSSLGRIEARVMPNLDAVIATLGLICGADCDYQLPARPRPAMFQRGQRLLNRHTDNVFGRPPYKRRVRIMVTLPDKAAEDYDLIRSLLERGTDCVRINCAHETKDEWKAMIGLVRKAEQATHRTCKVAMDLGGPKSRIVDVIVPEKERIFKGDTLLLTGDKPVLAEQYPFQARCTLREALEQVEVGSTVWIDDGKIGARIEALLPEGLLLRITHARDKGEKLQSDKGVNFPDTELRLASLTDKDLQDLDFIAHHADIVHYSFVQEAADMELLHRELAERKRKAHELAVIAKIETAKAIRNLPELIVSAAGRHPFGVMIARGDLAVEIGYERLSEMQEEILWLCEAAHVPVIWATQVLENLAKKGRPSRAEMTDVAMSERAECVMLNKGPYILEAVSILDDVLTRMQAHQLKKTPRLRALRSW